LNVEHLIIQSFIHIFHIIHVVLFLEYHIYLLLKIQDALLELTIETEL